MAIVKELASVPGLLRYVHIIGRAGASPPSLTTCARCLYNNNNNIYIYIIIYTSKLKILQIIMWNIGMAQKAEETRLGCLVHILL